MTFSRDIYHHRPTPRTLQSSRFGPYSVLSIGSRRPRARSVLIVAITLASVPLALVIVTLINLLGIK